MLNKLYHSLSASIILFLGLGFFILKIFSYGWECSECSNFPENKVNIVSAMSRFFIFQDPDCGIARLCMNPVTIIPIESILLFSVALVLFTKNFVKKYKKPLKKH